MIAPGGLKPLWLLVPVVLIFAVILAVLAYSLIGSRTSRFEVSADGLRIRGDLYGRFIPAESIRAEEARRVDFSVDDGFRPSIRTFGTGLPGYQSGWYRLASGDKALVYLTDRSKAVYVPTMVGYALLLSPDDADAFLTALKAIPN